MAGLEGHSLEPGRFVAGYSQLAPLVEDSLVPWPNHSGLVHSPLQLMVEHGHNWYKNVHCPVDLPHKTYSAAWLFLRVENMWLYSIQIPVKKQDRILQYITEENLKQ
jgi:hypothetical protein